MNLGVIIGIGGMVACAALNNWIACMWAFAYVVAMWEDR